MTKLDNSSTKTVCYTPGSYTELKTTRVTNFLPLDVIVLCQVLLLFVFFLNTDDMLGCF